MAERARQASDLLRICCKEGDGEQIVAHEGRAQVLLTFFGPDVKRRQAQIKKAAEQAAQGPLDRTYVRRVVVAANLEVRRALPFGANQGASIVVAFTTTNADQPVKVSCFALGDCSIWKVTTKTLERQSERRDIYLGDSGVGADDLAFYELEQFTLATEAGEYAVLAPAHYGPEVIKPHAARASLPLAALAGIAVVALVLGLVLALASGRGTVESQAQQAEPTPAVSTVGASGRPSVTSALPLLTPTVSPSATVSPASPLPSGDIESEFAPLLSATDEAVDQQAIRDAEATVAASEAERALSQTRAVQAQAAQPPPSALIETPALAPSQNTITPPAPALTEPTVEPPVASVTATPGSAGTPQLSSEIHGVWLSGGPTGEVRGAVTFSWTPKMDSLPPGYQYDLVFWNPKNSGDKRSPKGPTSGLLNSVDLDTVFASGDWPTFLPPGQEFCWGVIAWNQTAGATEEMLSDGCQLIIYKIDPPENNSDEGGGDNTLKPPTPTATPVPARRSTQQTTVGAAP